MIILSVGVRSRGTPVTGLFLFFQLICPKRSQERFFLCSGDAARLQTVSVKERKRGWVIDVNIINLECEPIRHRPRINPNWPFGINVKKSFGKMRTGNKSVGLIRMFSISIPINCPIHLPESENNLAGSRNSDCSHGKWASRKLKMINPTRDKRCQEGGRPSAAKAW